MWIELESEGLIDLTGLNRVTLYKNNDKIELHYSDRTISLSFESTSSLNVEMKKIKAKLFEVK